MGTLPSLPARPTVRRSPNGRLRTLETHGVRLQEIVLAPGVDPGAHQHPGVHVCVVLEGGFEERVGRTTVRCDPTASRISPPGDRHRLVAGEAGLRCLIVEARAGADVPPPRRRTYLGAPELLELAAGVLRTLDESEACLLELDTLGLELLAAACRRDHPRTAAVPPRWLRQVHEHLRGAPGESIRIGDLAGELGVHRVHLVQAFRRHYGLSPSEYLRRQRCLLARRLLLDSRKPLVEIALEAGFSDQSHLTRSMRSYLGITPSKLRRPTPVLSRGPSGR